MGASIDSESQVSAALQAINRAWRVRRYADLKEYFHPKIVFMMEGFGERVIGREAVIDTYRLFTQSATIHTYSERGLQITSAEETALVSFQFDMRYEIDGEMLHETGEEFFVFRYSQGRWLVVLRTVFSEAFLE